MTLRARVQVLDRDDRRSSDRRGVDGGSTLRAADAMPSDVEVIDLSRTGASFRSAVDLPIGTPISLGLAGAGMATGAIVRRDSDGYGCAFDVPLSPAQAALAFGVSSVVQFGETGIQPLPRPAPHRWPAAARLALLFGGAVASWAVAYLLLRAIL